MRRHVAAFESADVSAHSKAQFERGANNVRATARGHHFFASGDERRAHDVPLFQTAAATVALFEVANERAVLECERKHRLEWKLERARKVFAQMAIYFVAAIRKNLSRIENIFRIEGALDLAQYTKQIIAELFLHVFGARDADAVLGGE